MAIVINGSGTVSGLTAQASDVELTDSTKIMLGTGDDLQIYHDGSHSYISDQGIGNIKILASVLEINSPDDGEAIASFTDDGSVELRYNNSKKFETYASGVLIQGEVDGNGNGFRIKAGSATLGGIFKSGAIEGNSNADLTVFAETGKKIHLCANGSATKVLSVSANGLLFNGDTAAANALDDYEEGTYNVVVTGSTSGTFNMDSNDTFVYTKIGRVVTVQGYAGVASGTVSGNIRINLPFTPAGLPEDGEYNFSSLLIQNTGNTNGGQKYLFLTGGAYGFFYKVEDNGTSGYMHNNDVDSTFQFGVSFSYIAA